MSYLKFRPTSQLAPYVESIWIQESDSSGQDRPTQILPVGKIDLVFNYGDPFAQVSNGHEHPLPAVQVVGQRTRSVRVRATGKTGMLIVSFYPWGAVSFPGLGASEITDKIVDLRFLLNPGLVNEIIERIAMAKSHAGRIEIVQEFLAKLLDERFRDFVVEEAICRINRARSGLNIDELAGQLHISRRQLTRRFQQVVGVSPKTFSNIIRFQKALGYQRYGMNWREILRCCGYYDQAHLIKEFKSFSDYSPQSIIRQSLPTSLMRRFNCNELSHFYNTIYL